MSIELFMLTLLFLLVILQVLVRLRREMEQELARIPDWQSLVEPAMKFLSGQNLRNPEVALPSAVAMATTAPSFASDEDILAVSFGSRGGFFLSLLLFLVSPVSSYADRYPIKSFLS